MARAMTVSQLAEHIVWYCPRTEKEGVKFLEDCLGRFQLQAFRRGQCSVAREISRHQDVLDNAG